MRMTARDGSLELFGEVPYRRGSSRKPPRPHARRRRCLSEDVNRRSSSGLQRLTTFQKLDREMGRFVKEQNGCVHASEEDSSVRGVRRGVKWKCGWMFEQDSLYWETVRRQDVSGGESGNFSSRRAPGADGLKERHDSGASTCDSSTAVECEGSLQQHCSTDHESVSSGMELHLRRSRRTRRPAEVKSVAGQEQEKKNGDGEEEKRVHPSAEKGWPAVLKAKCEVLQMEKELADQRLRQQCAEMAQAAEMAHCLRASVQTILETAKRGTVSAPCTPGRQGQGDHSPCLQQRIQRLQTVNVQRDLEDQAKRFQNRIDSLRLQSQIRSADTNFQNDGRLSKTRLSSTSSTTQVLTSDGEDWAQVQEVLKQLRGKTGSLQYNCENWEKRALFAESKAASLQIEEEKWRIEAQISAEKVRELERELFQLRSTLEEVRNRHALEQSRLLGSGSNHGYTLVLQPIVTASQGCRCTPNSPNNNEPCSTCGSTHCHSSTSNHHTAVNLPNIEPTSPDFGVSKDDEVTLNNGDEIRAADVSPQEPASLNVQVDMSSSQNNSPERDEEASETTSGTASVQSRHRYEGALEAEGDDMSPSPTPEKSQGQQLQSTTTVPEPANKTEVERSLSQKWFKQRPKSRRPGSSALGLEMSISESTRSHLGNSPIPAKALHRGRGGSNHGGFSAGGAVQKPGPVYAGSMRVSSPSLLEKRVPLREIKRNATASNGDISKSEYV